MDNERFLTDNLTRRKMVASFTPAQLIETQDWVRKVISEQPEITPQVALAAIPDKKERGRRRFGIFALGKLDEFQVPWEKLDRVYVWRLRTDVGELSLELQPSVEKR